MVHIGSFEPLDPVYCREVAEFLRDLCLDIPEVTIVTGVTTLNLAEWLNTHGAVIYHDGPLACFGFCGRLSSELVYYPVSRPPYYIGLRSDIMDRVARNQRDAKAVVVASHELTHLAQLIDQGVEPQPYSMKYFHDELDASAFVVRVLRRLGLRGAWRYRFRPYQYVLAAEATWRWYAYLVGAVLGLLIGLGAASLYLSRRSVRLLLTRCSSMLGGFFCASPSEG